MQNKKQKVLFSSDNYKAIITNLMDDSKKIFGRHVSYEKLAQHCRIQKSYLSKVMNDEKTHLTSDQLFLTCRYLQLTDDETRFLQLLLSRDRSGSLELKNFLEDEIYQFRQVHLRSEKSLETVKSVSAKNDSHIADFFLDIEAQIIHVALSIERFARDIKLLAKAIGMPEEKVVQIVLRLEGLGLIERTEHHLKTKDISMHLTKDSPYFSAYRHLIRFKLLERLSVIPIEVPYNFSVFFAATEEVKQQIHSEFLAFLKTTQKLVSTCEHATHVFQMNFDLCPWSN